MCFRDDVNQYGAGHQSGGGTLGGTVSVHAVNGMATFSNLWLNKVGIGYTLIASATGLQSAVSTPFNIIPGAATQLVFLTQPSTTIAGVSITPGVTVEVLDVDGNLVTGAATAITLAIGTNPGNGKLSGAVKVNAINGVATFSNLSINAAGVGYTLKATASGLTGANSYPFTILPPAPILTLTKSVSQLDVAPGSTIVYTLAYTNTGTASATNVVLTDQLPSSLELCPRQRVRQRQLQRRNQYAHLVAGHAGSQ